MKTALITAVNGFVGSQLAGELVRQGWRVCGTTSSASGLSTPTDGLERKLVLKLGSEVEREVFAGVDVLIHYAYDLRAEAMECNVVGTKRIAEAAAQAGVAHQLFVRSYSAHNIAVSDYRRTKFILQQFFLALGHAVIRPGLIIGPGGMFDRMAQFLKRPIVPLADGGRDKVPIVALADFQTAVSTIVEARHTGLFNLFNPELVTLKDLFTAIRSAVGSRTL